MTQSKLTSVPIVDKNGKATHVRKRIDGNTSKAAPLPAPSRAEAQPDNNFYDAAETLPPAPPLDFRTRKAPENPKYQGAFDPSQPDGDWD